MITKERREEVKEMVFKLSVDHLEFSASLSENHDHRDLKKIFVKSACSIGAHYWRMLPDPSFTEISETARVCHGKAFKLACILDLIEALKLADPSELNHLNVQLEVLADEFCKYVHLE
jgi:hypothetical protein